MICSRCNKYVDSIAAERNVEKYKETILVCPYCGKAHRIETVQTIVYTPCNNTPIVDEENNDNKPCVCYLGPKSNGGNCFIFGVRCDGMSCKKDCNFYNKKGYFKLPKSIKKNNNIK
jgi:hypothetical protein